MNPAMSRDFLVRDPLRAAGGAIGARSEYFRHFLAVLRSALPHSTPLLHDICWLWGIDPFRVMRLVGLKLGRPWVSGKRLGSLNDRKAGSRTVVHGPNGARMTVGLRADCLEARLRVKGGLLVGRGNKLRLWLASPLPEAVRAAVVGRDMAEVFDYEALRGRRYEISRAATAGSFTVILAVTDVAAPGQGVTDL